MGVRVVIIGAGYAGVMAAKRLLRRSPDTAVTVVNPRPHFVQRIRLHQMVAGGYDVTVPLQRALPRQAQIVIGSVAVVDAADGRLVLDDGSNLDYDYLIYAAGSRQAPSTIAGADAYGFSLSTFEEAAHLTSHLVSLTPNAPICIVGGGLTGIETAAELAGPYRGRVTLVAGDVLAPGLTEKARTAVFDTLTGLGVRVLTGSRVTRMDEHSCTLSGGSAIASECTILTTEFGVPDLARRSGLPVDADGRLLVDERLECVAHPTVVGAGDAMAITSGALRMSCQAALPLGVHAADTVIDRIEGSNPSPVAPAFVGRCISLGRRDAIFQRTDRFDAPTERVLSGRLAALVKEGICSSTTTLEVSARRPIFYGWS